MIEDIKQVTREAFQRALQTSPNGVLCIQDGWLVRVKKDGSVEKIEPSKPKHKVKLGVVHKLS